MPITFRRNDMIINHNIPALNTYRSLSSNNMNTSKSLSKLSSGLRINNAGDDAAGLAISEKMRSQIRGLDQASRNAYDGKSLLQTAEGALNETHSILQRMKELAVQSSNDTNTQFDRTEIQKEIEQLKTEIDRISRDTEFNTMKLLDGTMGATASSSSTTAGSFKGVSFDVVGIGVKAGKYSLSASRISDTASELAMTGGVSNVGTNDIKIGTSTISAGGDGLGAKYGDYKLEATKNLGGSYTFTLRGPDGNYEVLDNRTPGQLKFDKLGITLELNNKVTDSGTLNFTIKGDVKLTLKGDNNDPNTKGIEIKLTATGYNGGNLNIGGLQFEFRAGFASAAAPITNVTVFDDSMKLHIGANADQNMNISVLDSSSRALGVNVVDLKTQKGANGAITTIDNAINRVSSERSKMGAIMNRLDHTIKNLGTTSENLTASESRIRDVDMAKEMMEFTKNNILTQASQSMLAQANMIPQGVLGLLQ
jgi:flagellin